MKNLSSMLKEAQKLQQRMTEMQQRLEEIEVSGAAGGGMIAVTLSGKGQMRKIKIDQHVIIGGPIQFDAKGQNVNIKAAAIQNLKRKPVVVMPTASAAAPLVFPAPGWNDPRRT